MGEFLLLPDMVNFTLLGTGFCCILVSGAGFCSGVQPEYFKIHLIL